MSKEIDGLVEKTTKDLLWWFELVGLITHACNFYHITTDETGLHLAEVARDSAKQILFGNNLAILGGEYLYKYLDGTIDASVIPLEEVGK